MKKVLPLRFVCSECHRVDISLDTDDVLQCSRHGFGVSMMLPAPGHPFQVGDGVHWSFNGDAYPGTVRKVSKSGLKVWVSSDEYRVTDAERENVRTHGLHEGEIDSTFVQKDEDEPAKWVLFKFSTAKGRVRFTDTGTFSLYHERMYSSNPHF